MHRLQQDRRKVRQLHARLPLPLIQSDGLETSHIEIFDGSDQMKLWEQNMIPPTAAIAVKTRIM